MKRDLRGIFFRFSGHSQEEARRTVPTAVIVVDRRARDVVQLMALSWLQPSMRRMIPERRTSQPAKLVAPL